MWKRDEAVRPTTATAPGAPPPSVPVPAADRTTVRDMVNIGKSVIIKGELSGSEDLTIEGTVEGKIELRQNILTIGPNAKIKAQIFAKSVIVEGDVHGDITATEKVDLRESGSVEGDVVAPRVAISDGAHFRGSIDMQKSGAKPSDVRTPAISDVKPVTSGTTEPVTVR